jgi:hypothetical protein
MALGGHWESKRDFLEVTGGIMEHVDPSKDGRFQGTWSKLRSIYLSGGTDPRSSPRRHCRTSQVVSRIRESHAS